MRWAVLAAAALWLAGAALAQCGGQQTVSMGTYYIYNPDYPNLYPADTHCFWRASSRNGSVLQLSCGGFDLPASTNCQGDRVRISLTGDDTLRDARAYCGEGSFTLLSEDNKLTMALETTSSSRGGRFLCNLAAVQTSTCTCGMKKQSRIVGGEETGVNEFPFMAGLLDAEVGTVFCGATILSQHYALTAAQCVAGRSVADTELLVGAHNISAARSQAPRGEDARRKGREPLDLPTYKIRSFTIHNQYNQNQQDYDIALVRVEGEIAMSGEVMPACLPFRYANDDFANSPVEVIGWGATVFAGAWSNVLQKALLYVMSPEQCSDYDTPVSNSQMCSYNEGKDACQGDSGGPLLWQDPDTGRTHVVGVVSNVQGCALHYTGINTRVTFFLDWIATKIGAEDTYCVV